MIPDRTMAHLADMSRADLELVIELIDLIAIKPRFHPSMPARHRGDNARSHMAALLDFAARTAGDEILREAYGPVETDRKSALQAFALRADLASFAFGELDCGVGSLNEAAAEARAVSQGDKPKVFEKLGRRRAIVLLRAKFEALRWDAWLNGLGVGTDERHIAIGEAFGAAWDTISRWREDVEAAWGREALEQIEIDRGDAVKGLRMWSMRPGEAWRQSLRRAGARYLQALRER